MATAQDFTREQSARGGRKAAQKNARNTQGRFQAGEKPLPPGFTPPPGFKPFVAAADHFNPSPIPRRLANQRAWPRIMGSKADLDLAVEHLETFADKSGIDVIKGPPGRGQAGIYNQKARTIVLAAETYENPELYAWVLAHELGHATDPRFKEIGDEDYKEHTGDYELVAEATALRTLTTFGLIVGGAEQHLGTVGGKDWRKRLAKTKNKDRYLAAVSQLRKPQCPDDLEVRRAARRASRADRAERRRLRHRAARYKDPIKLRFWR